MLHFACEKCGKPFHVDDHFAGKKGRCRWCAHVMRIPGLGERSPDSPDVAEPAATFRLSPIEERPWVGPKPPAHHDVPQAHVHPMPSHPTPIAVHPHHDFELVDDDGEPPIAASPEVIRGLSEIEEFQKNPCGYQLADHRAGWGWAGWFGRDSSRPASWIHVKWRRVISSILKFLRFVDDWAYLISVPFLMLMLFAIVISNRGLAHVGAVVVVLVNYGRFWTDVAALFIRPFKDGLFQGLACLFPPYALYYLFAHWDRVRSIPRRIATSCIPIVLVLLAYAFIPTVNPKVARIPDIPSKLRSAKSELIKDVENDLENAVAPEGAQAPRPPDTPSRRR